MAATDAQNTGARVTATAPTTLAKPVVHSGPDDPDCPGATGAPNARVKNNFQAETAAALFTTIAAYISASCARAEADQGFSPSLPPKLAPKLAGKLYFISKAL